MKNCSLDYNFQINHDIKKTKLCLQVIIKKKFSTEQYKQIAKAIRLAFKYHDGQIRSDGSPYVIHPLRVSMLLLNYQSRVSPEVLIAALLHDALEDTSLTEDEVLTIFGRVVYKYLKAVTRYHAKNETPAIRGQEKFEKWKLIMKSTHKIRSIKTFDYLDNMISWKFISHDHPHIKKIPRWLGEAKSMYLPLAKITNKKAFILMKKELEYYLLSGYKIGARDDT
jgi:(p)ppGpp synthase/HD superfamily hydrolase